MSSKAHGNPMGFLGSGDRDCTGKPFWSSEMMGWVVSIRVSNWWKSGFFWRNQALALLECETHVSAVSLGSLFLFERATSNRNHSWQYMAIIVHGERCHDRWCLMKCNANHVSGVSGGDWTLCKLCTRKWNTMTHYNFWWYVYVYYIYIYSTYITLHYITLHYITLHYITLHYITLHYNHYIILHYITYICIYNTYTYLYKYIYIHIPAKLESQEKLQLSHNRKNYLDSCNSPVVHTNSRNGKNNLQFLRFSGCFCFSWLSILVLYVFYSYIISLIIFILFTSSILNKPALFTLFLPSIIIQQVAPQRC